MRNLISILIVSLMLSPCQAADKSKNETKVIQPIELKVPARPDGQKDVIGLTTSKIDTVRIGFIGLGHRGTGAIQRYVYMDGTKIVALCDLHPDRVERNQQILKKAGLPAADEYSGSEDAWKKICERKDIDLIYIATDWMRHVPMAIYAMEHGKHVACEVPIATSVDECWQLVNTSEKNRKHCMMLENCCYDFFEMATLNMVQQHDVTSPRPYNRKYALSGTKGYAEQYPRPGIALDASKVIAGKYDDLSAHEFVKKEVYDELMKEYEHPITKEIGEVARKVGGHGGMDFIMDYRLIYCLRNGLPLDMNVYDGVEWSCIGELTELSVKNNGAPVAMPDFTRGGWNKVKGFSHSFAK